MQSNPPCPQPQPLTFYHSTSPNSLVMLYSPEHILSKMMQPSTKILFLFITQKFSKSIVDTLQKIQFQDCQNCVVKFLRSFEGVEELVQGKVLGGGGGRRGREGERERKRERGDIVGGLEGLEGIGEVVVVCGLGFEGEIKMLKRSKKIKAIIQFSGQQHLQDHYSPQTYIQQSQNLTHLKLNNSQTLSNMLQNFTKSSPKYKNLTTFITLNDQIWKSNVLVRTMISMLNAQIDIGVRRGILGELGKIGQGMGEGMGEGEGDMGEMGGMGEFLGELWEGGVGVQRAIYWYSSSDGIYRIMNNLLRSATHPSQTFYIQPFFKDLFLAIKSLQAQQCQSQKPTNFTCYKGGSIYPTQSQYLQKNIGKTIKNLCFLSTSLSQDTALQFKNNVMFQIYVPEGQLFIREDIHWRYQSGYANIREFSYYYGEDQILFNPLSSFQVVEFTESWGVTGEGKAGDGEGEEEGEVQYYVKLEYGVLANAMIKKEVGGEAVLSQAEMCLCALGTVWEEENQKLKNQGLILSTEDFNLDNWQFYWQKYNQIFTIPKYQCYGLGYWSSCYVNIGNYNQAQKLLHTAFQILNKQYPNIYPLQPQPQQPPPQSKSQKSPPSPSPSISTSTLPQQQKSTLIDLHQKLQIRLANIYNIMGNYKKSQQIYQKLCKFRESGDGQLHPRYLTALNNLAMSYQAMRNYGKAEELLLRCSQLRLKLRGKYHPDYLGTLRNLASNYQKTNHNKNSLHLHKTILKIFLQISGKQHPKYLSTLNCLGTAYLSLHQYKQAVQIYEQCCEETRVVLGERHPDYMSCLNNLLVGLEKVGDFGRIGEVFGGVLGVGVDLEDLEIVTPESLIYLTNLAKAHLSKPNPKKSLQLLLKTHSLSLHLHPQPHPTHLLILNTLATTLQQLGMSQKLLQIRLQCKKIALEVFGEGHEEYWNCVNNLGICLLGLGRYWEGLGVLEGCLRGRGEVVGVGSREYVDTLGNLANTHYLLGNHQKSLQLCQLAHSLSQSLPQPPTHPHPNHLSHLNNLALLYNLLNKPEQSLQMFQTCLKLRSQILGQMHPDYLSTLCNMAQVYMKLGKFGRAVQVAGGCVGLWERRRGQIGGKIGDNIGGNMGGNIGEKMGDMGWPGFLSGLNCLGMANLCNGHPQKSLQILQCCLKNCQKILNKAHPTYHLYRNNLAVAYQNIGEYRAALRVYRGTEKILRNVREGQGQGSGSWQGKYWYVLGNVGEIYYNIGQYTTSQKTIHNLLTILKKPTPNPNLNIPLKKLQQKLQKKQSQKKHQQRYNFMHLRIS